MVFVTGTVEFLETTILQKENFISIIFEERNRKED